MFLHPMSNYNKVEYYESKCAANSSTIEKKKSRTEFVYDDSQTAAVVDEYDYICLPYQQ